MGILCADSAVRAMDNQLGLLVRANDAPAIYSIALCRSNECSATRPFAFNLPISIRPLCNVLISAFHVHLAFETESSTNSQHEASNKSAHAVSFRF